MTEFIKEIPHWFLIIVAMIFTWLLRNFIDHSAKELRDIKKSQKELAEEMRRSYMELSRFIARVDNRLSGLEGRLSRRDEE